MHTDGSPFYSCFEKSFLLPPSNILFIIADSLVLSNGILIFS